MRELMYFDEPNILFGHNQKLQDPRDGLSLFGPYDTIYGINSCVLATKDGLKVFKIYLDSIQKPVYNYNSLTRPMFPGFETVFNAKWESNNILFKEIYQQEIDNFLYHGSTHKRTYDLVTLFIEKILDVKKNSDKDINVWFIVVPDVIYQYCKPMSVLPSSLVKESSLLNKTSARRFNYEPALFEDLDKEARRKEEEALSYNYNAQFHDQLKARLLPYTIPTQIIRESTLDWRNHINSFGQPLRDFSKIEGHLAWTLSTAAFYKAGGKPWILSDIRDGVCYLGLVYKKTSYSKDTKNACCAAQMFLNSGDGTVFKGEAGPWFNPESKEYHLDKENAQNLLLQTMAAYREKNNGNNPKELFIHAKTRFDEDEWEAFKEVAPEGTNLVGVTISRREQMKLYKTLGKYSVLRGLSFIVNKNKAFLWTIGFVPYLQTALSLGLPNPLFIEINKGSASIEQVLKDILALTKLNYNACVYGDGEPVTLRFADKIGEILTSSGDIRSPPLAFKYYI
jgi:hypothetical protein